MLGQCRRRTWTNIEPALPQRFVFDGMADDYSAPTHIRQRLTNAGPGSGAVVTQKANYSYGVVRTQSCETTEYYPVLVALTVRCWRINPVPYWSN